MIRTNIIDVHTGGCEIGFGDDVLQANGIGSCIVIVMIDFGKPVAGIAHIMLPGRCRDPGSSDRYRYAFDAIDYLLEKVLKNGGEERRIRVCMVGGANVLKRPDDTICKENIAYVKKRLEELCLVPVVEDTGGFDRRSVTVDIGRGLVLRETGDRPPQVIFDCAQAK